LAKIVITTFLNYINYPSFLLYLTHIRKLIALILAVVFVFSITPQKYVHDLAANHVDQKQCLVHKKAPIEQVEQSNIHCTYNVFVSTVPFLIFHFSFTIPSYPYKLDKKNDLGFCFITKRILSKDLRGPPTVYV